MKRLPATPALFLLILPISMHIVSAEKDAEPSAKESQEISVRGGALAPFNSLIGDWRGVGQLQRGSSTGAWTEPMTCQWNFENGQPTIMLTTESGRQFEQLRIFQDKVTQEFVLQQTLQDSKREYRAAGLDGWPDNRLELTTRADANGVVYRCTLQQLSEIRATVLFEKQASPTATFRRTAGIGYTRAGARLAEAGAGQRKCIVTGGLGTISVSYEGRTYFVCCQGCLQAFNESPAEIIADYQSQLQKQKQSP